jgi:hypothetical protein
MLLLLLMEVVVFEGEMVVVVSEVEDAEDEVVRVFSSWYKF